jgi:phosphoglycolate phosphatase
MSLSLVVFDLDGTLIDSAGGVHQAINRTLADFGCNPLSISAMRGMIGEGAELLVSRALAASGCSAIDAAVAVKRYLAHYEADPTAHSKVYPGVREVLSLLRARGIAVALLTHKPARLAYAILRRFGLDAFFGRMVGADSLPIRKPDPQVLLEILSWSEAEAGDSLMVGDSEVDAATAQAACVAFVLMTHGYHRGPTDEIPCVARFEHFDGLRAFIER